MNQNTIVLVTQLWPSSHDPGRMALLCRTILGFCCSFERGDFGRLVRSISIASQKCRTVDIFGTGKDAYSGASTNGNGTISAAQRPELSSLTCLRKQWTPQRVSPLLQNLGLGRAFGSKAAQSATIGGDPISTHRGDDTLEQVAALVEKGSDSSKEVAPEQTATGSVTAVGPVKKCIECQRTKLMCDFKETAASPDGRSPTCRACLAVLKPQRRKQPLLHLGLSPKEAWERAKRCSMCGLKKELRDFARNRSNKDGLQSYCRSCASAVQARISIKPRTKSAQHCKSCNIVKPASAFPAAPTMLSGLLAVCRRCTAKRYRERYAILKQLDKLHMIPRAQRVDKICSHCGLLKTPMDFQGNVATQDCLSSYCRTCSHSMVQKNRRACKEGQGTLRRGTRQDTGPL